jgi:hypothetical protein
MVVVTTMGGVSQPYGTQPCVPFVFYISYNSLVLVYECVYAFLAGDLCTVMGSWREASGATEGTQP